MVINPIGHKDLGHSIFSFIITTCPIFGNFPTPFLLFSYFSLSDVKYVSFQFFQKICVLKIDFLYVANNLSLFFVVGVGTKNSSSLFTSSISFVEI
ncbi:unnamed protein product [Meloidogyne enterolobii]|uniref:Uncharacterized protein n=1 Tax=Meloidogyne enterolobii TaxID=390850 RepID=A0ACB0YG00_MELEN